MAVDKNAVQKEAQKFAAKGQFDKAIAEWKKLLRESPNDANIHNTIGDLCLKKNAKADAVEAYKKAADLLSADGFTSKAIALYKKILNIDPKKIEVHLSLADLNAEKGLTGNALESYKLVADHYAQKNETAKVLGVYQKMADLNPANVAFRLKLGDMYVREGLKAEAVKTYLEAAETHVANNAFQDARQIFEKVLEIDPHNKQVYHKAGSVYFKEGKFAEACKALKPAFEADPANQELTDLYIDALGKAGKNAEAEEVYHKILSQDPGRMDIREKLFRFYLTAKHLDKALTEALAVADAKVQDREYDAATEILKAFVAEAPANEAARRKLSDLYSDLRRDDDAAREMVALGEALLKKGDRDGAREAVNRALEIVPGHVEAQQLLEKIEGAPAAAATAPEPEAAPEPAPAFEPVEAEPVAAAPEELITAFEPVDEAAAPAPDAVEEEPEEVTGALTEADVLIKYGLASKAIEQLEELAGRHADSVQARIRLRDLYREQGDAAKAAQHAVALADIHTRKGMQEQAEAALREALQIDPANSDARSRLGGEAAVAEAPAAPSLEEELAVSEKDLDVLPATEAPPLEQPTDAIQWQPPVEEALTLEEPESAVVAGSAPTLEDTLDFDLPVADWKPEAPPKEEPTPALTPEHEMAGSGFDLSEAWAEAEFFYQQGLFDSARQRYEEILRNAPGEQRAQQRIAELSREKEEVQEFSRLAEAVEGLESYVPTGRAEEGISTSSSDEEAVRSLMEEIQQMQSSRQAEPAAAPKAAPKDEVFSLGGGDDEFFDLAAELREELGTASGKGTKAAAKAEEQSLDEIFEDFKKGIEIQAKKEDSDTHYNLGIAYKEMELLDDAIGEFLQTREGEPMFVESRYMLGLCFMQKGEYLKAATELRNAAGFSEALGGEEEQRLSMLYDLGLALQGSGNIESALQEFKKVQSADPGFRDVASKIRELEAGDFVSLDELKQEIEQEIAAKFFEEGERIEREEKTRKSEKVSH